jgi:hypothetical protein
VSDYRCDELGAAPKRLTLGLAGEEPAVDASREGACAAEVGCGYAELRNGRKDGFATVGWGLVVDAEDKLMRRVGREAGEDDRLILDRDPRKGEGPAVRGEE